MSCEKTCTCGCCDSVRAITPVAINNRPGLDALLYRAGEHGSFFETMKARLASTDYPALEGLGARTTDDPSIALLDGWASVADVLTFYQERLANEGYLRTATERRSVLELARLIGYAPRPGVAATVYLAYEIDKNAEKPAEIPAGSRVQSLPGPGEVAQTFETMDKFVARKEWSAIRPRLERPNSIFRMFLGTDAEPGARVYLKGAGTGLKVNDALLIQVHESQPEMFRVTEVSADSAADRTKVRFKRWDGSEVRAPADTRIRRALAAFQRISLARFPAGSLSLRILAEMGGFLAWLDGQASAVPLHPDVEETIEDEHLVTLILTGIETLTQAAVSAAFDKALVKALTAGIAAIEDFAVQIEEFTGIDDGGLIGAQSDALAARLKAIDTSEAGTDSQEDARASQVLKHVLSRLAASRSVPPRNAQTLERDPANLFDSNSDVGVQAVAALAPEVAEQLSKAIGNAAVSPAPPIHVYAFRQKSLLFGSTAPRKVVSVNQKTGVAQTAEWSDADINSAERNDAVHLETPQEKIQAGSWVALDYSAATGLNLGDIKLPTLGDDRVLIARAGEVMPKVARAEYNLSGQTTLIPLLDRDGEFSVNWFTYTPPATPPKEGQTQPPAFQLLRRITVYAESEELPLAMEPIDEQVCGGDQWIETDDLYSGLESGRWIVVGGERADVPGTEGVKGSELVMLDAVRQYVRKLDISGLGRMGPRISEGLPTYEPGEKLHTFLKFATPLEYCYKRSTLTINANVVKASHGDTRAETLGAGDAAQALQAFTLRQPPLTYVPANEPDGLSSTLKIYVNDVEWHEAEAMVALDAGSRGFVTRTDDEGKTTVVFGNGKRGARLPTGLENVKAIYRSGIGKGGNVKAGQISQLLSRPLGVKGVVNPQESAGGADKETRDQARKNAPLAVMALDRLVGTRDYADFSRTFAGIAKAVSARVFFEGGDGVYVTIAGVDDTPIPQTSDLYANLVKALRTYGDVSLPLRVQSRELLMLLLSARIAIDPAYRWEDVAGRITAKLLDRYSFERQELGESVVLSEVTSFIQNQRGVRYVDMEALGAVSQLSPEGELRSPQEISKELKKVISEAAQKGRPDAFVEVAGIRPGANAVLPARLAFLLPSLATETLLLNRIED